MRTRHILVVVLLALLVGAIGAVLASAAFEGSENDSPIPGEDIDWSDLQPLPERDREDFCSEPAGDDAYRFWPRSTPVESGVVYAFDTDTADSTS